MAGAIASGLILLAYQRYVVTPPLIQLTLGLMLSYLTAILAMCLSVGGRQALRDALEAGGHLLVHVKLKSPAQVAAE